MDDLFNDLVFLGGTPIDSINLQLFQVLSTCQIKPNLKRITLNRSQESNRILHNGTVRVFVRTKPNLHNGAVRVFVKIMHGFTQLTVKISLM